MEVNYAFPNTLSHYALSNQDVLFDVPLSTSANNIAALLAGELDFAVTVTPLTTVQATANPNITALPIAAAAFVPVYRLDALNSSAAPLTFSGATLALIHAGNITNWSDPLIQADNVGVVLPNQNITVVFQNQSRRFNYILLTAFNKFEPSIASILPPSSLPEWPTSRYAACIGVTGITGTSAEVVDVDGALSIDTQNYAIYTEATIGAMNNSRGNAITATELSLYFTLTEQLTDMASTVTSFADMTDCQTTNCWPIACAAYVLLDTYASPRGCEVRTAMVDFLLWYYQETDVVARMLTDYGLQSLDYELQEQVDVADALAAMSCLGESVDTAVAPAVYEVVGVDRLLPLINMVVDLHAIVDSSVDFEYDGMTSTAAMLEGRSMTELAIIYEVEINSTATPIDYERYVLMPAFLTSIIVTFNVQLSSTVTINTSELVLDVRTLALLVLGNISDWSDPRLVALNPILATALEGNGPSPIRLVHGCFSFDIDVSTAPMSYYLYQFLLSTIETDPVVLAYLESPEGQQARTLLGCSQAANTGRFSGWVYVAKEDTITSIVATRPGSMGYAMDSSSAEGAGAAVGTFALLMPAVVNGQPTNTVRRSTPTALMACALAGQLDSTTLTLDVTAAWAMPDCWPLTQVVYMQIPRDFPQDSFNLGVATVDLLQWIYQTDALDVWCNQNMLVRTASSTALQSVLLSTLETITSGGSTVLTLPNVWQLTPAIAYTAYAMLGLGWLVTIVFIGVTIRYRSHASLRSASPLFMVISLLGIGLLFASILALVLTPTSQSCVAFSWLIQLGFTVTFAPLFAKAYRIYRIFGRRKLQVVKISNRKLLLAVAAGILADVIFVSIWHAVAPPTVDIDVQLSSTASATGALQQNEYAQCAWDGSSADFMGVECVIKVASLCVGVMLAFSTRQVTDRFNDSKSISLSIYNLVLALVVILPILLLIDAVGNVRILLLLFCIVEIGFVTLGVLYLPKLLTFMSSNNMVMPSQSVYQSSSDGFSFLSAEQLAGMSHLNAYIAALVRHVEEARRVQAGKRGVKLLIPANASKSLSSPPDTARRQPEAARGGSEVRKKSPLGSEVQKRSVWMGSSQSQLVSPTAASSRGRRSVAAADSGSAAVHVRDESGGQDKEVESAVKEAVGLSVVSPRSAAVPLSLAASPRAIGPLIDMQDEVLVASLDNSVVKAVEIRSGTPADGSLRASVC